jgi:hypothetical protein
MMQAPPPPGEFQPRSQHLDGQRLGHKPIQGLPLAANDFGPGCKNKTLVVMWVSPVTSGS